jgi:hypothetical protein
MQGAKGEFFYWLAYFILDDSSIVPAGHFPDSNHYRINEEAHTLAFPPVINCNRNRKSYAPTAYRF